MRKIRMLLLTMMLVLLCAGCGELANSDVETDSAMESSEESYDKYLSITNAANNENSVNDSDDESSSPESVLDESSVYEVSVEAAGTDNAGQTVESFDSSNSSNTDIILVDSSIEYEPFSDDDVFCCVNVTLENNCGETIKCIMLTCAILDSEDNVLGTFEAWMDASIADGKKVTMYGEFSYQDYPAATAIRADSCYCELDESTFFEVDFSFDESLETTIYLDTSVLGDANVESTEDTNQVQEQVQLTSAQTYGMIDDGIALIIDVISEYNDLVSEVNGTSISRSYIKDTEELWANIFSELNDFVSEMAGGIPSDEYLEAWGYLQLLIEANRDVAETLSDWDMDGDGMYTGDECTAVVQDAYDLLTDATDKYIDLLAESYLEPPADDESEQDSGDDEIEETPSKTDSSSSSSSSSGTNSSTSSGTTHVCEVCGEKATYSIIGITGQTEWYCTTHYNEMNNLIEQLFDS